MLVVILALAGFAIFRGDASTTGNVIDTSLMPRWTSMPVLYRFEDRNACGTYQARRIDWALETIAEETNGAVSFREDPAGTLVFVCNRGYPAQITGYIVQGEAHYAITQDNTIIEALVYFNNAGPTTYSGGCKDYPDLEVHEILHAFGFEHTNDRLSIMYWQGTECRIDRFRIDRDIVEMLQALYPLPSA